VLPRDFQLHPFRPKAISINWLRYRVGAYPGAKIDIPLKSFNEERCPGIKEGGWLLELVHKARDWPIAADNICSCRRAHALPPLSSEPVMFAEAAAAPSSAHSTAPRTRGDRFLELQLPVYASGESIPDYLMMDLRGLKGGDKIMASQVELNDGVLLVRALSAALRACRTIRRSWRSLIPSRSLDANSTTQRSKVRDFAIARMLGSRKSGGEGEEGAVSPGAAAGAKGEKAKPAKAAA
jgi:hypothetical protein